MTTKGDLDNLFNGLSKATANKFQEEVHIQDAERESFLAQNATTRQAWEQQQVAVREQAAATRAARAAEKPATLLDVLTKFLATANKPPFEYLLKDDNKTLLVKAGNGNVITIVQKPDPDKYNSFKFDVTENGQTYDSTAADVGIDLALFVVRNQAPAKPLARTGARPQR